MTRFRITWYSRQLAIVVAENQEEAKSKLLSERGYAYLSPEVVEAERLPALMLTDAFGNKHFDLVESMSDEAT